LRGHDGPNLVWFPELDQPHAQTRFVALTAVQACLAEDAPADARDGSAIALGVRSREITEGGSADGGHAYRVAVVLVTGLALEADREYFPSTIANKIPLGCPDRVLIVRLANDCKCDGPTTGVELMEFTS
jgi:hypothetical protein